jgi:4-hydroxy-2-oxoheptanedioate aldolase
MKRKNVVLCCLLALGFAVTLTAQPDPNYKPRRLNQAIELLEDGQPIYYTTATGGAGYDQGKAMAKTWADMIVYEMEHGVFDLEALRQFMKGLVDGGPTKSGHRIPYVTATLPVVGLDEAYMRANTWVIDQVLATGVMGIDLCHARDPKAIEVLVQASRYPFERPGIKQLPLEGLRGSGSQGYASQIWGISGNQYLNAADVWPLNPKGEILLGLKLEDKYALANAEKNAAVPGIGFAEWGPGDMTMSLVGLSNYPNVPAPPGGRRGGGGGGDDAGGGRGPIAPVLAQARAKVLAATKANHVAFLNSCNVNNVIDLIKEGVMVCAAGGANGEATAQKGREYTKRKMPW